MSSEWAAELVKQRKAKQEEQRLWTARNLGDNEKIERNAEPRRQAFASWLNNTTLNAAKHNLVTAGPKERYETHYFACVPYSIESHWHPYYGPRLVGFPVNICYTGLWTDEGLVTMTYAFDPSTFAREGDLRRMHYFAAFPSRFWVRVTVHDNGKMETFKYHDSKLLFEAQGPDFQTAMIQTTMCALIPEETTSTGPSRAGYFLDE